MVVRPRLLLYLAGAVIVLRSRCSWNFVSPLLVSHSRTTTSSLPAGRSRSLRRAADGDSSFPSFPFDLGSWWQSIEPFREKYFVELAESLAEWTAPILGLSFIVILIGITSGGKSRGDDFGFEEDDKPSMGLMFGGKASRSKLKIRSLNRQVNRYLQTVARATKGLDAAMKMRLEQDESYIALQKDELAADVKVADSTKGEAKQDEDIKPGLKRVWVLTFQNGRNDLGASGVQQLREEITAVVMAADPKRDEVVLRLDSPGGTVTGYGLAGAQLLRLKDAGLRVNVAIDQVAASGGYLMACTADRIICSTFAIIGSIGVVQELPIVYDRLKREGIQFETTTAGKFKRTLTPFKEPTEEDRQKNKADLQDVLTVFKGFVKSSRPTVDIEKVATGETWLGPLAKEQGLVDDLMTSDALLLGFIREGRQVLEISSAKNGANPLQQALGGALESAAAAFGKAAGSIPPGGVPPPMARASSYTEPSVWSGINFDATEH